MRRLQRFGLSEDLQRRVNGIVMDLWASCNRFSEGFEISESDSAIARMGYDAEDFLAMTLLLHLVDNLLSDFSQELDPLGESSLEKSLEEIHPPDSFIDGFRIPDNSLHDIAELQQLLKASGASPSFLSFMFQVISNPRVRKIRGRGRPRSPAEVAIRNQFFTPDFVTDFLLDNTVGRTLLPDVPPKDRRVDFPYFVSGLPIDEFDNGSFESLRVLDPALGCANFFQRAIESYSRYVEIDEMRTFAGNVHGYDIDPYCVYLSKIVLLLTLAQNGIDTKGVHFQFASPLDDCGKINKSRLESISSLGFLEKEVLTQTTLDNSQYTSNDSEFARTFGKDFDVVLMNPPYGDFPEAHVKRISRFYPSAKQDYYSAFVARGLELLRKNGLLGALTSRTGFYLKTFRNWRREWLTNKGRLVALVELGMGMMMNAAVDTSCYIVQRC